MPPKPRPQSERRHWFASHRVNAYDQWQAVDVALVAAGRDPWVPVPYEQVPDQLWRMSGSRDGWKFYTDRTRRCDERGFPLQPCGCRMTGHGDSCEKKKN